MDRITDPAAIAEQLGVQHHFLPHLYAKEMHIKAGTAVGKHTHDFTHVSVLAKGRVRVIVRNDALRAPVSFIAAAPHHFTIDAGSEHEIHALEDSVWYCIHVTDETDPEKIDHTLTGN